MPIFVAAFLLLPEPPLSWPINGSITSEYGIRWGKKHEGIDIGAVEGMWVRSAEDGKVIFAGEFGNYGNLVVVRHANRANTYYAHLQNFCVFKWQRVKKGQKLGRIGMTGRTTGPHLHFEVRINRRASDPMQWLPRRFTEKIESTSVGGP